MDTGRAEQASIGYVLMRHSEICSLPLLSRSRQPVSHAASMEPRSQYGATGGRDPDLRRRLWSRSQATRAVHVVDGRGGGAKTCRLNTDSSPLGEWEAGDGASCHAERACCRLHVGKVARGLKCCPTRSWFFYSVRLKSRKKLHVPGCSRCQMLVANMKRDYLILEKGTTVAVLIGQVFIVFHFLHPISIPFHY